MIICCLMLSALTAAAQVDRSEVRSGNRRFKKGDFRAAAVEYMRALDKDSTSFAGNYNLASVHYRLGSYDSAAESLGKLKEVAGESRYGADYYYNLGDVAIAKKDWQGAVDAFKQCLILDPGSIEAKENYIYAKKHLENNNGGGQNDQNQNKDQNKDQNQDQDQNQDHNKDQDKDQNKDNKDQQGQQPQPQPQPVKVSPQQAQQMLQAIQAKEKNTQEKVEKAKAAVGVRKNEKNW